MRERLKGIFEEKKKNRLNLYTKNLAPGFQVYGESLVNFEGSEYRLWDPLRSKLAAAIQNGVSQIGLKPGYVVLYLGASSGTTASHVSDIVGEDGFVFALDSAPRMVRDLVFVCESRHNLAPILANAFHPEEYVNRVCEVDFVYQDISQKNQAEIFIRNVKRFLKKGGFGFLCVKARSIDVTARPSDVFKKVRSLLEKELTIVDHRNLEPFEKDHCVFVCKY